jgi:D-sedoheptulose 7-phosphate isomerase
MSESPAESLARRRIAEGAALAEEMLAGACAEQLATVAELTATAIRGGGKVLVFGNGGSAAEAIHFAAELVGRYLAERDPLPAIALTENVSSLTAIGNDYGYEEVFARQVRALAAEGDVVIGMTTSGGSANVVKGLQVARELGAITVAMTGGEPGSASEVAEHCIGIPNADTPRIQEGHLLAVHVICEWVEASLAQGSGSV